MADDDLPPGPDISVAPNYDAGMVWITLGDAPRKLIPPETARDMADRMDDRFGDQYDDWEDQGYDVGLADKLREVADQVE